MDNGLIERLEVIEGRLRFVWRAVAEVFVEPPVRRFPSVGVLFTQLFGEVFADERVSVE
jgi:hypothetical protein